jgi:hypothetical protein
MANALVIFQLSRISLILNQHLSSLLWIETTVSDLQTQVTDLSKRTKGAKDLGRSSTGGSFAGGMVGYQGRRM